MTPERLSKLTAEIDAYATTVASAVASAVAYVSATANVHTQGPAHD